MESYAPQLCFYRMAESMDEYAMKVYIRRIEKSSRRSL